jgi:NADPH2:quinone reductase
MIATLAGDITQIDLRNIYVRNIRIIGSTLRSRSPKMKAEIINRLTVEIWPKVEQGLIKPTIFKILPIEQAEKAHSLLENGINVGKVVLKVVEDTAIAQGNV